MTGNGNHTTYKNGDDWRMVYYCFTHITLFSENIYWYLLGITLPVARGITMDDWDSHFFKAYFFFNTMKLETMVVWMGWIMLIFPSVWLNIGVEHVFQYMLLSNRLIVVLAALFGSFYRILSLPASCEGESLKSPLVKTLPRLCLAQQVFLCLPSFLIFEHAMCLPCNILHHWQI